MSRINHQFFSMAYVTQSSLSGFDDFKFCEEYLPKVSRTFAINIRILRGEVYRGILLAYLLCRIADTIEDDQYLAIPFKIEKLKEYAGLFPPASDYQKQLEFFLHNMTFEHETDASSLLLNTTRVFNELVKLPAHIVAEISQYVKEMALGMAQFQEKGLNEKIVFFANPTELDHYCYFVAGTVGRMITAIFSASTKKISPEIKEKLKQRSVAFGLGLQVTNIAKDFAEDRKRGWNYVPSSFFIEEGVDPDYSSEKPDGLLKVEKRVIRHALGYLDEALKYILDIPRTLIRYRLFCAWPLFMAVKTLAKLNQEHSFVNSNIVKITRKDVRRIIRSTTLAVMSNSTLRLLYNHSRPEL